MSSLEPRESSSLSVIGDDGITLGTQIASHPHSCGGSVSCTCKSNLGLGQVAGRATGPEGLKCGQSRGENS